MRTQIGADFASVPVSELGARLRSVDQYQSVLFYISIDLPTRHKRVFRSQNLKGREIPDIKGKHTFSAETPALGPLRIREFLLPPYDVTIATSALSVNEGVRAFAIISFGLIIIMLAVSIGLGMAFARFALKPIRAIRATADRIGSNNLAERIPIGEVRDEVDELAQLLNRMFDRLEIAFGQMQRFASEASHELKTSLSLIRLHAESIAKTAQTPAIKESAIQQIDEIARLNTFIDQVLFISRVEANAIKFERKHTDPADFLIAFSHDAEALAEYSGHHFRLVSSGCGVVAIEASWMRQLLLNLVSNALQISPPNGVVTLWSSFDGHFWRLAVEDEGPGLAEFECQHIFAPFVRLGATIRDDRGAGLGLAIAQSIATLHGGSIQAEPIKPSGGLRVVVMLPQIEWVPVVPGPTLETV